jgi:probable phosphoglycerate mutase
MAELPLGTFVRQNYATICVVKKIYLIRHGQTRLNVQGIVQGSGIDEPLNDVGHAQAAQFYAAYRDMPFAKVYTSRLVRTHQSVQPFLETGLPHEQFSGLNEISWGYREGTRITPEEDIEYHGLLRAWARGDTHLALKGGESPEQVAARQKPVIDDIFRGRPDEETILVCMHGRAMRVLLCQLLNYPLSCMDLFEHRNLCLYQVHYTGSMFSIHAHLDTRHLR